MDIYALLEEHRVPYERVDHPPVFTCEEADRMVPPLEAARTKNLFLRNKKGDRHFLVTVGPDKAVDIKALGQVLEAGKLSLGSPQRLKDHLGVEPGSVTLLAAAHDGAGAVEVYLDRPLAEAAAIRCHPLVNTSTLGIPRDHLLRFLEATGHPVTVVDVPARG